MEGLMEEFAASPEAQSIIEEAGGISWAATMMDLAFSYLGSSVPEMSLGDFNEVLFELIPRKVACEAEAAPAVVAELRAFWSFLRRQYGLANAQEILDTLTDEATTELSDSLSDPASFGMAKSFVMLGTKAGFDMTTQEGLDAFMLAYNSRLLAQEGAFGPPHLGSGGDVFFGLGPGFKQPGGSHKEHEKKRKARKTKRQARKRNRR
jgi:hypothetical protein